MPPTLEDDLRSIIPGSSNAEILSWHRDSITHVSNEYEFIYGRRLNKYKVEYTLYVDLMADPPPAVQAVEVEEPKVVEPESLYKPLFQEYD